ncbi:MAG: hypothetical protein QOK39_2727 [Acidimicrobiaceae bacterium]|jgi:hypothetical protein|nr:hypothetical protein [Acidimicrobiaceae bacterium]
MRRVLGTFALLIVAVAVGLGISVAIHHRPGSASGGDGGTVGGAAASTTTPVDIVPAAGQTFVTGSVTSLTADNALGPALQPPFTITIPSRGQGSADITGVAVAGKNVEIYWYGGQPLPVSGTGQLAIDGGALTVDASGLTWMLDGAPRSLTSGHFNLGAPVAVGSAGLAESHQSIAFDAGATATVQTTGKAQVHVAPTAVHLSGPGSVTIHGEFQVQTSTGTGHATAVKFGPGSYEVDLTPVAGGDTIRATLQGPAIATA